MPRSRPNPRRKNDPGASAERGYVLIVFTLFAVLLVTAIYTILPKYVFEGRRIKEEELIFRGQQYTRAIQLFVRKNGRYPLSLDELQSTNQVRFIRQLYPDPMTKDGEWRLIHVAPGPVFYDALNQPPQPTGQTTGATGVGGKPGTLNVLQGTAGGAGGANAGGSTANSNGGFGGNNGNSGSGAGVGGYGTGAGNGTNGNPTGSTGTTGSGGTGFGAFGANGAGSAGSQSNSNPQTFGSGGPIAGVASKDEDEAIKVINGFHHYNEWEFIFNYVSDPIASRRMAGAAGGAAAGGNSGTAGGTTGAAAGAGGAGGTGSAAGGTGAGGTGGTGGNMVNIIH